MATSTYNCMFGQDIGSLLFYWYTRANNVLTEVTGTEQVKLLDSRKCLVFEVLLWNIENNKLLLKWIVDE